MGCALNEGVGRGLGFGTNLIVGIRDRVRRVPPDVVLQGLGVELAPRDFQAIGESFGILENIIGKRDGGFHTKSITEIARPSTQAPQPISA